MPRIVDREARQNELARAAVQVFAERGYHGARMQDVADCAGVSKGSLYDYFPSKEALLLYTAEWLVSGMGDGLIGALESSSGPLPDRLEQFAETALESVDAWSDISFTVLRVWAELQRDEEQPLRTLLGRLYVDCVDRVQQIFDAAVARGEVAPFATRAAGLAMFAALDGCLLQAVFAPAEFELTKHSGVLAHMFRSVLRVPEGGTA